jgi:Domain of unknown function (DUF3303)
MVAVIGPIPIGDTCMELAAKSLAEARAAQAAKRGAEPSGEAAMLFMVIERFKDRDAKAVYRRFSEQGRGAPEGLTYVGSWIEASFERCFQLMECDDARLLQGWVAVWSDLIEFEIVPVVPSAETRVTLEPLL